PRCRNFVQPWPPPDLTHLPPTRSRTPMADIDCHSEMTKFHREKVTLSNKQQDEMRTRRNAGRTRLENGLNEAQKPQPKEVRSQGSYQMRTMVQDDANDYDIDDG